MKRIVLGIAAGLLGGVVWAHFGIAHGADLKAAPLPAKAPALVAAYDPYTGIYLGAEIGYGFNLGNIGAAPVNLGTLSAAPQGFVGGAYLGLGTRIPGFLAPLGLDGYIGLEGDFDGADLTGTASMPGLLTASVRDGWLASVRARFGLIYQNVMFYGTAGWGFGGSSLSLADVAGGTGSTSTTQNGFTWGGGVEFPWFFGNGWKARLQYLQYDFGTLDATTPNITPLAVTNRDRIDKTTVGLSYKF